MNYTESARDRSKQQTLVTGSFGSRFAYGEAGQPKMCGRVFGGGEAMRKSAILVLLTALLVLALAATAQAATPTDIYNDWAADGDLDGSYTQEELDAVLTDATLAQYADQDTLDDLKNHIQQDTARTSFPFTGFEAGMAAVVAVLLVGGGIALRRSSR
jgi:hypothetical protein